MATTVESFLPDALLKQVAADLGLHESVLVKLEEIFKGNVQPEIQKNYLSHLKNSLEDLINERIKSLFLDSLREMNKDNAETLGQLIQSRHFKIFTIQLIPFTKPLKRDAFINFVRGSAIIYYRDNLDEKQKRIWIAHELGHVFFQRYINDSPADPKTSEAMASAFALIAILDKEDFYSKRAQNYCYGTKADIVQALRHLLKLKAAS